MDRYCVVIVLITTTWYCKLSHYLPGQAKRSNVKHIQNIDVSQIGLFQIKQNLPILSTTQIKYPVNITRNGKQQLVIGISISP